MLELELKLCSPLQIWSGSSDGTIAVTDLDSSVKMDSNLARSLKTPSGKGTVAYALCTARVFAQAVLLELQLQIYLRFAKA